MAAVTNGDAGGNALSSATNFVRAIGVTTMRGATKGMELTQKAVSTIATANPLSAINIDRITSSVPKVRLGGHSARIARLFKAREGTRGAVMPEEISSDDEAGNCTEQQLHERVNHKYFDPSFDGVRAEVQALPAEYAEEQAAVERELAGLEAAQRERDEQLRNVNAVLKKRILENYEVFVDGVCRIREVNDELLEAASECKESRGRLAVARHKIVENGLTIPRNRRRRDNLRKLLRVLEAMHAAKTRGNQLRALHTAHRFRELLDVAKDTQLADPQALVDIQATDVYIAEWSKLVRDPEALLKEADEAVERCIGRRFDLAAYLSAVDAYVCLSSNAVGANRIGVRLLGVGSTIVTRVISDIAGQVRGDVQTVARCVPTEAVPSCVGQLCARILETVVLIRRIIDCHAEVVDRNDPSRTREEIEFHRELGGKITVVATQVGELVLSDLKEAAENFVYKKRDTDGTLHLFYLMSLVIESLSDLFVPKKLMADAREGLKVIAKGWVLRDVLKDRCTTLVGAMENDEWQVNPDVSPKQFKIVENLLPDNFKRDVKRVKGFVAARGSEEDNPFLDPALRVVGDESAGLRITEFEPTAPHTLIVAPAALVGNTAFVLACRVVARYPPLATEMGEWLSQICSMYFYIAAGNFVSTSLSIPLEQQQDFTPACREELHRMREACLNLMPELKVKFPPRVHHNVEGFGDKEQNYAITQRMAAVESAITLFDFAMATMRSLNRLLSEKALEAMIGHASTARACALEVFHVGFHRLVNAVFAKPLTELTDNMKAARWPKEQQTLDPSPYTTKLRPRLDELYDSVARGGTLRFHSRYLEDAFYRHVSYAVQCAMVQGFAAVAAKKGKTLAPATVMQMKVDSNELNEVLKQCFGANVLTEGYTLVKNFVTIALSDHAGRVEWLRRSHAMYRSEELVGWLAPEDRARAIVEELTRLGHDDHVHVGHFLAADGELSKR
jgi:hypothetical protein